MWYEIEVTINGSPYFKTPKGSIGDKDSLDKVLPIFQGLFPESLGYKVGGRVCHLRGINTCVEHVVSFPA